MNIEAPSVLAHDVQQNAAADYAEFQKVILNYYTETGRNFPWRTTDDPYEILVSEFMLQQTQTERVVEKYNQWLRVFPTVETLAAAPLVQVLEQWVGLGYNRRARFLHESAKIITDQYGGIVPSDPSVLQTLPGIGAYTASAVSTFAYNKPNVFIETNIRAVFIFFFFKDKAEVSDKELFPLIEAAVYTENPRIWYYALMDYGAELKKKVVNPNRKSRHYTKQSKFEGSVRQVRGALIRSLTAKPAQNYEQLLTYAQEDVNAEKDLFTKALDSLVKEGLVAEKGGTYSIE